MWCLLFSLFTILVQQSSDPSPPASVCPEDVTERRAYYAQWIGVKAPAFPSDLKDRLTGPAFNLNDFSGKRVLLYSFDAGNFVNGPASGVFPENLRTLHRVRKQLGEDQFITVGVTHGTEFLFPPELLQNPDSLEEPYRKQFQTYFAEIRELSRFPVLAGNRFVSPHIPEPYRLLVRPSSIVIDKNSIIRAIFTQQASEQQLLDALNAPDWSQEVRDTPIEDPWNGEKAPRPARQSKEIWSKPISGVVGLTSGDWDGNGVDDILVLCADNKLHVLSLDGDEKQQLAMKAETKRHQMISWTSFPGPTRAGLLLQCRGGWPEKAPAYDTKGQRVRSYSGGAKSAIDSASWVDIDGDLTTEIILGLNGRDGLLLLSQDGEVIWENHDVGNRWCVAGFSAHDDLPGLVLSSGADGVIRAYDKAGKEVHRIKGKGYVTTFAVAEMSDDHSRQILLIDNLKHGQVDYAMAADLEGRTLWKYPITALGIPNDPPMTAADLDGDGKKEWIFQCADAKIVAVDTEGKLLAEFKLLAKGSTLLATVRLHDKIQRLVLIDDDEIVLYGVE